MTLSSPRAESGRVSCEGRLSLRRADVPIATAAANGRVLVYTRYHIVTFDAPVMHCLFLSNTAHLPQLTGTPLRRETASQINPWRSSKPVNQHGLARRFSRSEERRVGKECRS